MPEFLRGIHRAPNIQTAPEIYEIENRATDPDGLLADAMRSVYDWKLKVVLDLGAGTGFYLPFFAADSAHVLAIEPHGESRLTAMRRCAELGLGNVSVMHGSAAEIFLADRCVDFCHCRFAYFWPPDCEPGIRELQRIMRPGGAAVIIDNDYENGLFGSWLMRRTYREKLSQPEKERFWASHGFSLRRVSTCWRFDSREDLESVVRLEFGAKLGDDVLAEHSGLEVEYVYCLYHRPY